MQTQLLEVLRYTPKNKTVHTPARSFYALSFRLKGTGRLSTKTENLIAKENDLALVPANLGYEHAARDEDIIVFHFGVLDQPFRSLSVHTPAEPQKYRTLFLQALQLWQNKEVGYLYRCQAVFYEILALMEREGMLHRTQRDPLMAECRTYIDTHFEEPDLTIAALARRFGCSEAYLRRRFTAAYNCAPKAYLSYRRLGRAAGLLELGFYTQTEIAEMCGYKDVKYFRTAFKTHFGRSITQYLKKQKDG